MPYKDPAKRAEQKRKWAKENPEYAKEYKKNNKKKSAEYMREYHLMKTYNMTIEDWNEMYKKQNGCCAICGIHQMNIPNNGKLHVDHNHKTGKVRGLLCSRCNQVLGLFDEDVERMQNAYDYLTISYPCRTDN